MEHYILYLGYWSISEPLTKSVIIPRLQILSKMESVKRIVFVSIERTKNNETFPLINKVDWVAFESKTKKNIFATKLADFIELPALIAQLVKSQNIDLVIGNSPLAGGACYLALKKTPVPLVVECFEPHADSMIESQVWTKLDPRFWVLKYMERKQKKCAWKLQVVSKHYRDKLLLEGVDSDKIEMLANCLSLNRFVFNISSRERIRHALGWSQSDLVGIYVGKFGGIYYYQEAFDLFAAAINFFGKTSRLIILTPDPPEAVSNELISRGLEEKSFLVRKVPHEEVPNYLSVADFAFATIKATPNRQFCCPVKNGEYWANGLPILLEKGIGDDSDIIEFEGGGIILDRKQLTWSFQRLENLLISGRVLLNQQNSSIAFKYRRMELVHQYYEKIFTELTGRKLPTNSFLNI